MKRVALLALALLAAGCGGGDEAASPLPEGRFLGMTQTLTPEVQLFAEPVTARIEVLVDRGRFDPDRLRIVGRFEPYEQDGRTVRTRRDQGRYTHLRFELTLRCLVWDCLPRTDDPGATPVPVAGGVERPPGEVRDRRTHTLEPALLVYDDPDKGQRRLRRIAWPQVASVSRLNFSDRDVSVLGFPFEAAVTPVPEATYRVRPSLAGTGLLAAALALLAFPAGLVVRSLRRKPLAPVEEEPELAPLERALALVEWACEREPWERRGALEVLAGELGEEQRAPAAEARQLAWSRSSPSPDALADLVRRVREA